MFITAPGPPGWMGADFRPLLSSTVTWLELLLQVGGSRAASQLSSQAVMKGWTAGPYQDAYQRRYRRSVRGDGDAPHVLDAIVVLLSLKNQTTSIGPLVWPPSDRPAQGLSPAAAVELFLSHQGFFDITLTYAEA